VHGGLNPVGQGMERLGPAGPEPARPLSLGVARGLQQHPGLTAAELEGLSQEKAARTLQ
jgi:hypothetical protein